jgi:hypothetical protein
LLLVLCVASLLPAAEPLTTVDRTWPAVDLVEFREDGRITFAVASTGGGLPQPVVVDFPDLVVWGAPVEYGPGTYAATIDGGVFTAETVAVVGETFDLLSSAFGSRSLPLSMVRGAVFHAPAARAARDRLFRRLAAPGEGDRDRVLLSGGDEVQGTLTSLDSRHANLETSVGAAKIDLGRTAAVVFNPALAAKFDAARPRLLVGLRDGTLVVVASAVGRDRVRLEPFVAETADQTDSTPAKPWEVDRREIGYLQMLGGRTTYLSDLAPTGYKHVPYLDASRDYRLDRSVGDGDLRAGGRRYRKGVAMHSTSRLTFPLDAAHRRFAAEIAIDDDADGRGSVTFRVFVDTEERYRSEIVRGGDPPQPIEVDVAGGKQLSLIVDFAEEADVLDHADWLNARLLP